MEKYGSGFSELFPPLAIFESEPQLQSDAVWATEIPTSQHFFWP